MHTLLVGILILIGGIVLSFLLLRDQYSVEPKLKYKSKHTKLEWAFNSVLLYLVISLLVLIFFLSYWKEVIIIIFKEFVLLDEIIESGLCFAVMIPLIGCLIDLFYSIVMNLGGNRWRLDKLEDNETKWILILTCLVLGVIGIFSKNFLFGFSAFALAIGRFFWFDVSKTQIAEECKSVIKLPVFILIAIGLGFFVLVFMCISEKYVFWYSLILVFGFVLGIILYAYRNKGN